MRELVLRLLYYPRMTKDELQQQLTSDEVVVLDIREAEEVAVEPGVPGSVHMPMGKVFVEAYKGTIPKDKKIVSVCKTGGRCRVLTNHLNERGFNADFLEGGLNAWNEAEIQA